ncbi:hypothetical protein Tco_0520367 [Tanacetum coccineum]
MIQPEPEGSTQGYPLDSVEVLSANALERFYTSAGNHVKEILPKLNLPDHMLILMDLKMEVKIDTFLSSDDSISPDINDEIFYPEGDIHLIEELLNNEIPNDLPPPLPVFEINETEKIKTSIEDPPDLELKDLPPHLK